MRHPNRNQPSVQRPPTKPEAIPAGAVPAFLRAQADGVLISVKVQPRASANEVGPPSGEELRLKVTAPPVDAAANDALIRLLAETLDCPRNRVELVRGHTSRHKVVKVYGATLADVLAKLSQGPKQ